jgi:hypothetical protein
MKNAVLLDVILCDCCKNQRFGGMYRLHYQGDKTRLAKKSVASSYQQKQAAEKS